MSAQLAELPPTAADLERELASVLQIVAQRPKAWLGVPRPPGLADDVYFTNLAYYAAYPGAALKIDAKSDPAGVAAWKRLRELVLKQLLAQVPVSPNWNPKLPTWPLPTSPRDWSAGSDFSARRPWKKDRPQTRKHTGIDLKAAAGVPILAPESGVVVASESGWEMQKKDGVWRGVKSLIMVTDSGFTVLLGGVRPGSAKVKNGERVMAGQQLAVVGNYPLGDSMLHFQLYGRPLNELEVNQRKSWPMAAPPPSDLVNPREYLEAAASNPKTGVVGVVPDNQAPDEGALVENDVEAGELDEGTAAGDGDQKSGGSGSTVALVVGGVVLVVAGGVVAALWASRPTKRPGRRAA